MRFLAPVRITGRFIIINMLVIAGFDRRMLGGGFADLGPHES